MSSQPCESASKVLPIPVEERWAMIEGARMRYLCAGSGPPLILVHGLLGYSFSWRFTIPVLAKYATVYAIDMLGAGFSDRPAGLDCTFSGCARRLLLFADQVGISSFDLLGTSHGGAVAISAAAQAVTTGRLKRLILVAAVNPWSAHGRHLAHFLSGQLISRLFVEVAPRAKCAHRYVLQRLYGDPGRISPGTLEGYSRPFEKPGSLEYAIRILSSWADDLRSLETALAKIRNTRSLIVWGSLDRAVDPASALILQRHLRPARLVMLDGVGHLPYEEVPEQFNQVITEFLQAQTEAEIPISLQHPWPTAE
jgi:pimeloyl-ACP methyl ester carboxylesterase